MSGTETERALKRLIKHYTTARDWRAVEQMFLTLGEVWSR